MICTTCNHQKTPIGRDAPAAMANSLCGHDCPGYDQDPYPITLWPGEEVELWVAFKGRESIVEMFEHLDRVLVRELWPDREPRNHATSWHDAGYTTLDRGVYWTVETP